MPLPVISASVAAIILILQLVLMILVGMHRVRTNTGVGMGDDKELERKIRRHGNLAENAALFLVVLALAELVGGSAQVLTIVAVAFVVARLSHALAFSSLTGSHGEDGNRIFIAARIIGAFGTFASGLFLSGYLLYVLSQA
ncbi:MAG: MAPEG family protein [Pseudomonadota bacterium]